MNNMSVPGFWELTVSFYLELLIQHRNVQMIHYWCMNLVEVCLLSSEDILVMRGLFQLVFVFVVFFH